MIWFRVCVVGILLSLLEAHKHCTQQVKWGHLLQTLSSMGSGISEACAHHYDKHSLCDPSHMLSQVELNAILVVDIVKKAEVIYRKHPNPQTFAEGLQYTRHVLTQCAHHSHNVDHEPVATCFNKLEAFLHKHVSHADCAWEIINATVKEILQRLEKRIFRKRR